jgi:hypothetical protein
MREYYFNGLLMLDENDQSRMNYIVIDLADSSQKSVTDVLDKIYNSNNTISKLIRVIIKPFNSSDLYGGFESLCIKKDRYGTYSYHVGDFALENRLFKLTESNIEMWVEDYTDTTETTGDLQHGKTS